MQPQHTENASRAVGTHVGAPWRYQSTLHQTHSFSQNKRTPGQNAPGKNEEPPNKYRILGKVGPTNHNSPENFSSHIQYQASLLTHNHHSNLQPSSRHGFGVVDLSSQHNTKNVLHSPTFTSLPKEGLVKLHQNQVFLNQQTTDQTTSSKRENILVTGHLALCKENSHEKGSAQTQGNFSKSPKSNFLLVNQQNPETVQPMSLPGDSVSHINLQKNRVPVENSVIQVAQKSHNGMLGDFVGGQFVEGGTIGELHQMSHGNNSSELIKSVAQQDRHIRKLISFIRPKGNPQTVVVVKPNSHVILQSTHTGNADGPVLKNQIQRLSPVPREIQNQLVLQHNNPQHTELQSQIFIKYRKSQNTKEVNKKYSSPSFVPEVEGKKSANKTDLKFGDRLLGDQELSNEMQKNAKKLCVDLTMETPVVSPVAAYHDTVTKAKTFAFSAEVNHGSNMNKSSVNQECSKGMSETNESSTLDPVVLYSQVNNDVSSVALKTPTTTDGNGFSSLKPEKSFIHHSQQSRTSDDDNLHHSSPQRKISIQECPCGVSETEKERCLDDSNDMYPMKQHSECHKDVRNNEQKSSVDNSTSLNSNRSSRVLEFPQGDPQHTDRPPVDEPILNSPVNKRCNEPLNIVCYVCTDTVNSETELRNHLFFGPIKCSHCQKRIGCCDMLKPLLHGDEKCKKNEHEKHDFKEWCTDPLEYITYHINRDLVILNFCKYDKNVPVTQDEINAELAKYKDKLTSLEETVPWNSVLLKIRSDLLSLESTNNKEEKTKEVLNKKAVFGKCTKVQPGVSSVQTGSGKSSVLGESRVKGKEHLALKKQGKPNKKLAVSEDSFLAEGHCSDNRFGRRPTKHKPWDPPAGGRYLEVRVGQSVCPENCPECYSVICPSRCVLNLKTFKVKYICEECSLPIFLIFDDEDHKKSGSSPR